MFDLLTKRWDVDGLDVVAGKAVVVECDSGDLSAEDAARLANHIAASHDAIPALQGLYLLAARELGGRLTHHPALTGARLALARAGVHCV